MKIALLHNHFNEDHLNEVKNQMETLGSPIIHVVYMECFGHYAALEGCHRLRAAYDLGLDPKFIEIEYSDDMCSDILGYDENEEDYPISEICDESYQKVILEFD